MAGRSPVVVFRKLGNSNAKKMRVDAEKGHEWLPFLNATTLLKPHVCRVFLVSFLLRHSLQKLCGNDPYKLPLLMLWR